SAACSNPSAVASVWRSASGTSTRSRQSSVSLNDAVTVTAGATIPQRTTCRQDPYRSYSPPMVALGESPQPLYLPVYRLIADEIAGGTLARGDRRPSEGELPGRLGVSRATVRRALGELATDGLVTASASRGSFVASGPLVEPPNALLSFTEL